EDLDELGAGGGAVALPQLLPRYRVVRREVERSPHRRQVRQGEAARPSQRDLDEHGPGGGAVALPQLGPAARVADGEEEGAVGGHESLGQGAALRREDADQGRAGGRAVTLPQLRP